MQEILSADCPEFPMSWASRVPSFSGNMRFHFCKMRRYYFTSDHSAFHTSKSAPQLTSLDTFPMLTCAVTLPYEKNLLCRPQSPRDTNLGYEGYQSDGGFKYKDSTVLRGRSGSAFQDTRQHSNNNNIRYSINICSSFAFAWSFRLSIDLKLSSRTSRCISHWLSWQPPWQDLLLPVRFMNGIW